MSSIDEQIYRELVKILTATQSAATAESFSLAAILDELNEQTAILGILSLNRPADLLTPLNELVALSQQTVNILTQQSLLLAQIAKDLAPVFDTLTVSAPIITGASMANNTFEMNVGQSQAGVISPLLADGVTASGGVVSNTVVTFTDPSATFVLAPDNITITFTGVADSAGVAVAGTVTFTVTDTDTAVSTWTDAITVTVHGVVPPSQLTQSAPIVVGTATP